MSPSPPSAMDADSDSELSTVVVATPAPASVALAAAGEANQTPSNPSMLRSQIRGDRQEYYQQLREQSLRRPSSSLRKASVDQPLSREPPSDSFSPVGAPPAEAPLTQAHLIKTGPLILSSETPSPVASPSQKLSSETPFDDDASRYEPTPPPRTKKPKSESAKKASKKASKTSKTTSKTPPNTAMPPKTPPSPSPPPAWSSGGSPTAADKATMALLDAAPTPLTTFLHRYTHLTLHFPTRPDRPATTLTGADSPATGFAADEVAREIDITLGGEREWARVESGGAGEREAVVRRAVREGEVVIVGSGGDEEGCVVRRDEQGGVGVELGDVKEAGGGAGGET